MKNVIFMIVLAYFFAAFCSEKQGGRYRRLKGWQKSILAGNGKDRKVPIIQYWINDCCGAYCRRKCARLTLQMCYVARGESTGKVIGHMVIPGPRDLIKMNFNTSDS
ncbi:uncharacterized protein LOC130657109 [Hydractinia symbiolongicarpus]|uniref:uncharacterized protein LOC130657109 n=1 Tax=Hydractinia symbiolongicarpus TaxID=13093 RepID=UPI00254C0C97|nr:uncharacterized protein LOC130657109 [Hydractinia symbiolongicarpus]